MFANPRPFAVLFAALMATSAVAQDEAETVTAAGNEPFWRVEITSEDFTLFRPDFEPLMLSVVDRRTESDDTQVIVSASSSPALRAVLSLAAVKCGDTMADQTYPFTATLELGDTVYSGCGGDPRDLLTATEVWTVTEIAGVPTLEGTDVELGFGPEGEVFGSGGCNRLMSRYELTGEGLTFGPAASTMMACPEEIMAQEQAFFATLEGVYAFDIGEDGALILMGESGPVMRAVAAE